MSKAKPSKKTWIKLWNRLVRSIKPFKKNGFMLMRDMLWSTTEKLTIFKNTQRKNKRKRASNPLRTRTKQI